MDRRHFTKQSCSYMLEFDNYILFITQRFWFRFYAVLHQSDIWDSCDSYGD